MKIKVRLHWLAFIMRDLEAHAEDECTVAYVVVTVIRYVKEPLELNVA